MTEVFPKVSVIVPVYGVEKFVARAVESMMRQTLSEVEFIFVDDCTPDNSMGIIHGIVAQYPQREECVCFLYHDRNKGLPAARNSGLDVAKGEYIFHWDADDYAEPDMLERMYETAKKGECDYVWADWLLSFQTTSRTMFQPSASSSREALTQVLSGEMKYNVWNKLITRKLYTESDIRFPEGKAMGEDMTMIKLLANANRVAHVPEAFYHYIRTNNGAMTQIYSDRHLKELMDNTEDICNYLDSIICDDKIERELGWFKLNVKLPFLFSGSKTDLKRWEEWYPESNTYIMSNHFQSLRTRMLQEAAAHGLTFINRLYTLLLFNFVYGKIYK